MLHLRIFVCFPHLESYFASLFRADMFHQSFACFFQHIQNLLKGGFALIVRIGYLLVLKCNAERCDQMNLIAMLGSLGMPVQVMKHAAVCSENIIKCLKMIRMKPLSPASQNNAPI